MKPTLYILTGDAPDRVKALVETVREPGRIVALDYKGVTHDISGVEYIPAYGHRQTRYFTGMTNRALCMALDAGEEYCLVVNDDVTLEGDAIGQLLKTMEVNPDAGVCGPVQVDMSNPQRVTAAGFGMAYPTGVHYVGDRSMLTGVVKSLRWLTFCFVMYRMSAVRETGLLDRNLRMWFSDSDYSIRLRNHGYRVLLDESAIIRHSAHEATGGENPEAGTGEQMGRRFRLDSACFARKYGGDMLESVKG